MLDLADCHDSARVKGNVKYLRLLFFQETPAKIGLEFLYEQRQSLVAAPSMADGVLDRLLEDCAVGEFDAQRVGNGTLVGVVIVRGEGRNFDALHLGTQRVNALVEGDLIFVIGGGKPAEDERDGDHVLHAMVAVCGVRERPFLVDDA